MDINDIALGLFLIASAGSIISVIYLIVSIIKKNGKSKLCAKLIISFVALAIVCMIIPSFSDNGLTSQERKVLSKDYSQLTEDEKNAEKFNDKVKEYMDGEKTIQENIDKIITTDKKYQYVNKVIVKEDMVKDTFNLTIDMISLSKSTVGEVAAMRNIMVDKVLEVIKPNNVKIEFMNNDKYIDTYTFTVGKGWDKEVKPMN